MLSINAIFAQRIIVYSLTSFNLNSATNKLFFDIYLQSAEEQSIMFVLTSYYSNFNNTALSTPVLSNINPKYTTGFPAGDYNAMNVQISLGNIAVSIAFI